MGKIVEKPLANPANPQQFIREIPTVEISAPLRRTISQE